MMRALCAAALVAVGALAAGPRAGASDAGRFPGFTAPVTAPYTFEDPFITSGVSVWGIWHDFPESSLFQGGDMRVLAVQARLALTDRLALIATKDGMVWHRPDLDLLDSERGYFDFGLGLKYALIARPDERFILTASLRYEATNGSDDVYSGNGEGVWIPALSMASGIGPAHLIGTIGARLPVDGDAESTPLFYNLHLGYPLSERVTPFVALNGLHYLDDGDGTLPVKTSLGTVPLSTAESVVGVGPVEGLDVLNLGARGVEGNDVISAAVGVRIALGDRVSLGLAYERPVTRRRDLLKQRVGANLLLEF